MMDLLPNLIEITLRHVADHNNEFPFEIIENIIEKHQNLTTINLIEINQEFKILQNITTLSERWELA